MKPFQVLVKDDFFSEDELEMIWHELTILSSPSVLKEPQETGSAREQGKIIKQNRGIFLHEFYAHISYSPLFNATRKIFDGITEEFSEFGFAEASVLSTKTSTYLLQYYENADFYDYHFDSSITTVLYWLCKEPQAFSGGNLLFPELETTIDFKHNRMVMFPSWAKHGVSAVEMSETGNLLGRFSITQFLTL